MPRSIFRQSARCAFPYCKERRGTCNLIILDCAAGKDRTGVVSAILLHKSGMSREYIIADFMKTASNPEAYLAQLAGEHPGIRLDVITPHERVHGRAPRVAHGTGDIRRTGNSALLACVGAFGYNFPKR